MKRQGEPIKSKAKLEAMTCCLLNRSRRDAALFVLGVSAPLRVPELLQLRVRDFQRAHLIYQDSKTGERRYVPLNPDVRHVLRLYTAGQDGEAYLFPGSQGSDKPLSRSAAHEMLKDAAARCRLNGISGSSLRKTFGYWHWREWQDLDLLMDYFGHTAPGQTIEYLGISKEWQSYEDTCLENLGRLFFD